jgi:soluble lytic murein transglycosylase-like protein
MIEDMYSVMARIKEIRSRFGLSGKRSIAGEEQKGSGYREVQKKTLDHVKEGQGGGPTGREGIEKIVDYYSSENRVPASLVSAVIERESGYNTKAVSPRGAMGLMQLMPSLAREYNVSDPFNPVENIRAGVSHLKSLLDEYNGDYKKALAAYNAGRGAVKKYNGVPDYKETKDYVDNVINSYLKNR